MAKKIIFGIVCIATFALCYYFTNSMKYAFIGMLVSIGYGFWLIRVELGIPFSKEKREQQIKDRFKEFKKEHDKNSRDNPTI